MASKSTAKNKKSAPSSPNLPQEKVAASNFLKSLSIDNVIFGLDHGELTILLIKHA